MVRGDANLYSWSGGIAKVASGAATTLTKSDATKTWAQEGFDASTPVTIGDTTTQFDITNPAGTTFRYTFDGTGTNPAITAITVPIGTYVYVNAQNFAAGNKGIFVVTGVGADYFEVTNAAGVVESNKTIGTGAIYVKFTKVLKIGSTVYGYTGGESTTALTGVFPSAAAVVADSVAISAVVTHVNIPASSYSADFIKTVINQVFVGSYTSRLVYISKSSDFTNFTVPTPTAPGDPDLLTLDNCPTGIGVRKGQAHIGAGTSDWYVVSFSNITVGTVLVRQTVVDKQAVANLAAPLAHEFIDSVGDDLVYISKDQQLRIFGTFRNITTPKYPSLSQAVKDEFAEEDFDGGALRAVGDMIYITAPNSGRDWMHETRESVDTSGNVVAERFWHPPQVRNISRFAVIDGVVFGHSNANPQIYQVWDTLQWHDDSPADEPLAYECRMRMAYQNGGDRVEYKQFDKAYFEGYMPTGVQLNANVYMEYQGAAGLQTLVINSDLILARFFSGNSAPSIGDASLGDNPIGDGLTPDSNEQELVPKFKVIRDIQPVNIGEYDLEVFSTELDSRWEMLCLGVNGDGSAQESVVLAKTD